MKGERPLFSESELVSAESRKRWDKRLAFVLLVMEEEGNGVAFTEWEEAFIQDMEKRRGERKDLTLSQSSKLNQIFHKVEEAVG